MAYKTALPILLLCVLPLGACADRGPFGEIPPESPTTLRQVQGGVGLSILPGVSTMTIDARWNLGNQWTEGSVALGLKGGHIALSADDFGTIQVSDIAIDIGEVVITSDHLASDIHLTDVSVHQSEARECEVNDWSENRETCNAWLQLGLVLDWSLVTAEGLTVPLGAQELVDIPMQVDLSSGPRGLEAQLQVDGDGALWTWAHVLELHGLQLNIGADEIGPVD